MACSGAATARAAATHPRHDREAESLDAQERPRRAGGWGRRLLNDDSAQLVLGCVENLAQQLQIPRFIEVQVGGGARQQQFVNRECHEGE